MTYYGDFPTSAVVYMVFDTFAAATGAPTATTNFAAGDVLLFKNVSATQRTSANGITVATSFDSNTGLQTVAIDTSDNTDAGFYAAGNEYQVAITPITADGQTLTFWLGTFSIQRAGGALATLLARTPNAAAGASGGLLISGSNAGTTTLAALTITGATIQTGNVSMAAGLTITQSTSNASALVVTGNGTGHGIISTSGSGASGNGISALAASTNGVGLRAAGSGTQAGFRVVGGTVGGMGIDAVGGIAGSGAAAGAGLRITGGAASTGGGETAGAGFSITGGAGAASTNGSGVGIAAVAGGTTTVSGAVGMTIVGTGALSGLTVTSGSGSVGDGAQFIAASTNGHGLTLTHSGTGADLNATTTPLVLAKTTNITGFNDIAATAVVSAGAITTSSGKVSGVILTDTVTTYTGNTPQTGDNFARIGAAGVGLTNLGDTRIANLDAAVTTRMASYTQPTGFLAATFPTTVASSTNITGGTITTVTNLTNAPTAGDFTATMKTSLNAATPASVVGAVGSVTGSVGSVVGAVGSVTGNVGGNVVGSVGSVTASVTVGAVASAASNIKKNTTIDLSFPMTDETTHELMTGLAVTAQRSIDKAAFGACANAVAEIGSTGVYATTIAAADTNGDTIMYLFTATGADDRLVEIITQP